jgi:hypothetical protein
MAGVSLTSLNSTVTDIVPLWRFELELPTITYDGATYSAPSKVYAQKVSVGNQVITDEGEPIANWVKHFPTNSTADNGAITMLEAGGASDRWSATKYWRAWLQLINSDDGNFGLPSDYWKTISVYALNSKGEKTAKFSFIEAWPTNIGTIDFDGEASQALWLTASIVMTRVKFDKL